ncbi:MAG: hypothetical protein EA409_03325 [Saprospirales bacterium]|nr:MAG: hypothetical protein EA409_03325 [Saprospirales bacterium]
MLTVCLSAQKVTVSEEISIRQDDHFRIIGQVGDRIMVLLVKSNRIELLSFDNRMRLRRTVEPEIVGRSSRLVGQLNQGNSFYLFTQQRDRDEQHIIKWEFDEQANLRDSSTIAIAGHLFGFTNFLFTYSEDRSKVLFFRTDNSREIQAFCYDINDAEILWDRNVNIDGNIRSDFRRMLLDNTGRMIMAMEKRERRFRRTGMNFEFFVFDADSDHFRLKEASIPDVFSYSLSFQLDGHNNRLIGAGLFYERTSTRAEGHYVIVIDLDSPEEYQFFKNPFPSEIMGEVSDQNVSRGGIADIEVRDFMLRNDGGVVIFSEISKVYERRPTYGQRGFHRSYGRMGWTDYYSEDVIITSFNPDGTQLWSNVLYKRQYSQDDDAAFSSFFIFETPSYLRLLFNDEIANNSTVSEYLVRADGRAERKSVLNTEYQNLRLRFRDAYQLSNSAIVVPSDRKSRLNLVKVEY